MPLLEETLDLFLWGKCNFHDSSPPHRYRPVAAAAAAAAADLHGDEPTSRCHYECQQHHDVVGVGHSDAAITAIWMCRWRRTRHDEDG